MIVVGAAAVAAATLSAVMTMAGNQSAEPLRTRQAPPIFSLPPKQAEPGSSRNTTKSDSSEAANPATVGDFVIGATVNLEALAGTGRMRVRNFLAEIDPVSAESGESDRAQFRFVVRRGLSSSTCVSLEAGDYPGFFLRQQTFVLGIGLKDGTFSDQDATFCPVPAPDGGFIVRMPGNQGRYLVARDDGVHLDDIDPGRATTFAVRTAL